MLLLPSFYAVINQLGHKIHTAMVITEMMMIVIINRMNNKPIVDIDVIAIVTTMAIIKHIMAITTFVTIKTTDTGMLLHIPIDNTIVVHATTTLQHQ